MNSKTLLISVFVLFVFITGTIYFTYNKKDNGLYYAIEKSETELNIKENNQTAIDKLPEGNDIGGSNKEIIIHIYGCVEEEGIYHLMPGSRVYEALELAGGYNQNASKGYVNLARFLDDGESIYFPTIEEEAALEIKVIESVDDGLININNASVDELINLPGIGDAKARSIIAYRTMNGNFEKIEDIMNVSGIKESLFMTIQDMIRV